MADLFILLPDNPRDAPLLAWREGGGWVFDTDRPAGCFGKGEKAVAFVPPTSVTTHRAQIIARKHAEARQTALFAIEDDVAEPVETLHVALGPSGETPERDIHVVSNADMQRWLDILAALGLPDADLVAPQTILPEDGMAVEGPDSLLFAAGTARFALDTEAPDEFIRSVTPEGLQAVYGERLARMLGVQPAGEGIADRQAWLARLAGWYQAATPSPVTLRQGPHAVRSRLQLGGLPHWRPVAVMAGLAMLLWIGSVWLETRALNRQSEELRVRLNDMVASVAPEAAGNPEGAIESLRQAQRAGETRLRPTLASAALYDAIAPAGNAEIRSLRFDAASGRLVALVLFDTYSQADAIGERLEASGLSVTLGDARQSGDRVLGEFVIEAAA